MITIKTKTINGFTILEVLIVMLISSVLMAAVLNSYITYINSVSKEMAQDKINAEVNSVFKILEKDIMMAGYGLPKGTRVASHNNCNAADETFCKANTDRLFLADGWELLTDITDNHEDDGQISATYMTYISDAKNCTVGGYRALLTADVTGGAFSLTVADLNINNGQESTASPPYDNDFKDGNAFIIGDSTNVEGHRIDTVSAGISLLANDQFSGTYLQASAPSVVPATAWYLRNDPDGKKYRDGSTVYWLYRNGDRVMPYVDNFKIQYGFDANNDGVQWADTVPPPATRIRPSTKPSPDPGEDPWIDDGWVPTPDGQTFDFAQLKVVKIILTIKSENKGVFQRTSYQTVIYIRN
jgi:prepilin-type N-terminal cleavage/methylation domain-containing protein